jgi:hypothetical protein
MFKPVFASGAALSNVILEHPLFLGTLIVVGLILSIFAKKK